MSGIDNQQMIGDLLHAITHVLNNLQGCQLIFVINLFALPLTITLFGLEIMLIVNILRGSCSSYQLRFVRAILLRSRYILIMNPHWIWNNVRVVCIEKMCTAWFIVTCSYSKTFLFLKISLQKITRSHRYAKAYIQYWKYLRSHDSKSLTEEKEADSVKNKDKDLCSAAKIPSTQFMLYLTLDLN